MKRFLLSVIVIFSAILMLSVINKVYPDFCFYTLVFILGVNSDFFTNKILGVKK